MNGMIHIPFYEKHIKKRDDISYMIVHYLI